MKFLFEALLEILLFPVYLLCGPLGYFIKLKPTPVGKKIVFVHGWLTNNPLYFFFKQYLEKKGFSVHMTDLGLMASDFNSEAKNLKSFVDRNNLKDFTLVGASGGAIVSYLYLQNLGGWDKTKNFISIGGPYKGSPLAYLAYWSGSARQIVPGNNFLKELNRKPTINANSITTISAKYDDVLPPRSSMLSGVKHEITPTVGHVVLQSAAKETFKLVEKLANQV